METLKLKSISLNGGYRVEFGVNKNNEPTYKSSKMLTSGPNKGSYKTIEHYRFKNEEQRNEFAKKFVDKIVLQLNEIANKKQIEKSIRDNFQNPYKVGQILYDSWGYGQTNVDFYQVVEVSLKSIKIRSIGSELISQQTGGDSGRVKPCIDEFTSEPELKKVLFYLDNKNNPVYHISSRHGWISNYEKGDDGVYCSWGY